MCMFCVAFLRNSIHTSMCSLVLLFVGELDEAFVTTNFGADIWLVTRMDLHMLGQIAGVVKGFEACSTLVRLLLAITLVNAANVD